MILHPCLLHFIVFLLPVSFSSGLIAKPGCPERCGDLLVSYPFGIGSNCSRGGSFGLICNTSTHPPRLHFTTGIQIIEINTSYVRVNYPFLVAGACYNGASLNDTPDIWRQINLTKTQFTLSEENRLTAIGCDDIAVGIGESNHNYSDGCVAYCSKPDNFSGSGFCPDDASLNSDAYGCCRTPIPGGTSLLKAQMSDLSGKWLRSKLFSCSYAFVEERSINQSGFSYPFSILNDPTAFQGSNWPATIAPPVVRLDWTIWPLISCTQAQLDPTTFACHSNTNCDDFGSNNRGYICQCKSGFHGNPYLAPGCLDIDECGDSRLNPCGANSICTNNQGSVACSCPVGYYGDGRKNGTSCTQLPPSKASISVWIGLSSGLGLLLLLSVCFWLHKVLQNRKNKMQKERFFKQNGGLLLQQQTKEGTLDQKTKHFSAKELEKATDHFNDSRILGQGGQGTVYKGMLPDGKIVAIKKSKLVDENHLEQFINEVAILSQINHRNVVRLLGCCLETEVPMLVYEFVPNGTLFDLIHDSNSDYPFTWNMRLRIAADVAGALAYLHSASSTPIFHRDIKSSNILLDEKYVVKVSDFGTSMSFAVDQTHLTTKVIGTAGYLDPEYYQSNQFTEKSDVYSFGVVLVELLTGQKPISLATRFLAAMEEDSVNDILDPQVSKQGVIGVARLAQRCLNMRGKMRPTMKEVATELESVRISQLPSSGKDEFVEGGRVYEAKAIMISDSDYTWTNSGYSVASSSSDVLHPLMFGMV